MRPNELLGVFDEMNHAAMALVPRTITLAGANEKARKLVGAGDDWLAHVHPMDRERVKLACESDEPARVVFRATMDQLKFDTLEVDLRPLGEFTLAIFTVASVDRGTSQKLDTLIEALPFEVWERDRDGILIRQNSTAHRNWGAKLGSVVDDMHLPADKVELWTSLNARAFAGELVSVPIDHEMGGRRFHHVNIVAPVYEGNTVCSIVGVNIDVTALRFAEAERDVLFIEERKARMAAEAAEQLSAQLVVQLSRSLEELERTQSALVKHERFAALGELGAVVAHEVRNPLAAIFNSLSTLKRKLELDSDTSVLFAVIEEESARLNRTVADLLNYVRPMVPDRTPDDVVELVREVARQRIEVTGAGKLVECEVIAPPVLEPVHADPVLLRIALTNLIANALQAMPSGGKLTITLSEVRESNRDGVSIAVADTGQGIPTDVRARVFEPFFTTRASGTGLGLAVVRRIIEAHDGVVSVESEKNAGAVFTITLPR